jgi:hypothetical protein
MAVQANPRHTQAMRRKEDKDIFIELDGSGTSLASESASFPYLFEDALLCFYFTFCET